MIPLIRKSTDSGIFGNKSYGKTLIMVFLGLIYYLKGYIIFSNIWVSYPHIRIKSINDFKQIGMYDPKKKKLAIMEDFEKWVHSRKAQDETNLTLDEICLDFGKNNCSLIYTSKRPKAIDIALRDTSDFFCEVYLFLYLIPNTGNEELDKFIINLWRNDFSKLCVFIQYADTNGKAQTPIILRNLPVWGSLYHTQEKIQEIKKQ